MSDESQVLAANRAFYDAFSHGSVERLAELWSEAEDIAVIHPGWPPLFGREDVMESWRGILEGQGPAIRCGEARAQVFGDTALVICAEHLEGGDLVATNVFRREEAGWRLVHHQAGPAPPPVAPSASGTVH